MTGAVIPRYPDGPKATVGILGLRWSGSEGHGPRPS